MDGKKGKKEYDDKEFVPCDVKLILLGDSAVGKSKLVERFLLDDYEERQLSTYALTMYRYNTAVDGKEIKIDIWDTAGQECFQTLHPSYYFQANVCILVFDVTRKITYQNLKTWYTEMRENCPNIPCILVANKIDVDRKVTEKTFKFASQYNLPFFYVSAADGTNVVRIFSEAIKLGLENKLNPPDKFYSEVMELLNDDTLFSKEDQQLVDLGTLHFSHKKESKPKWMFIYLPKSNLHASLLLSNDLCERFTKSALYNLCNLKVIWTRLIKSLK
eukprot:TRINITY_DN1787_c0_g1_i2.p1 TRINITY_DN1787_c0_g1~~TRINITY_DN1787_c0_g1_i2.p1  ORF type:complete len:274 (-),score=25.57 TRINITY_DN1787_c0_g1_i2:86-907(-)